MIDLYLPNNRRLMRRWHWQKSLSLCEGLLKFICVSFMSPREREKYDIPLNCFAPNNSTSKRHSWFVCANSPQLFLFLKLHSRKYFLDMVWKYLTKSKNRSLFSLVYQSSDRRKSKRPFDSRKKLVGRAISTSSKNFLLRKERASTPIYLITPGILQTQYFSTFNPILPLSV